MWGWRSRSASRCFVPLPAKLPPPPPAGIIHLTLWHGINPPPNRDVFQELVDTFNREHAEIEVEALYVGQSDQQMPKVLTAVIGGEPPDILWFSPTATGQFVELQALRSLDDWFAQLPASQQLDPALLESMRFEGQLWSVPMATNNMGLFYRPSLFAAAGITELPRTWAEWRDAARKLTRDRDGDGQPEQYGMLLPLGKGEWSVFSWLPFLYSAGGEIVANGAPTLIDPGAVAALQLWSDLLADGSALLSQPERGYEQDAFISGRVAMQLTGPWTLGFLPETPVGDDFAVLPIPQQAQPATVLGGESLFVMQTTPEREQAALEFLAYALSEEFQTRWALGTGYLPVNLAARASQTYQDYVAQQPVLRVFLDQMAAGRSRPILPGYARLSDSLGRAIEAVLLGDDPEVALARSQQRLELIWRRD
ncbi:MAG: ABC transporter substrate-binding protein [Spirulinaceae cyanobacterium SM2_1_0]|nr:ABC transporter substrate-binding protein [Spirulinaceae cyanobacterium SM2_1_0]